MSGFNTPADIFRSWKEDIKRKIKRKFKKVDLCSRCGWDMPLAALELDYASKAWCIDYDKCCGQLIRGGK